MRNRQIRIMTYIIMLLSILVMSWEQAYSQPLVWKSQELPGDAIRLRVLPNSDRPADQWLKQQVRDVVTKQMQQWTPDLQNSRQAELLIREKLYVIEELVKETIKQEGFNYPVRVTLGDTEFPTVQYGDLVYPAGNYRAVLIEIGQAEGKNWWCVLYPPLCLVDIASATVLDAAEQTTGQPDEMQSAEQITDENEEAVEEVEVTFFIAKLFKK